MVWRSWRGAERSRQLRGFGGDGPQFEGTLAAQENRDQACPQEQTKTVGQSLNDCVDVGSSVQSSGDLGQDFGAAVLLARDFAEPGGFQQAAQLPRENGRFGGEVFIKESSSESCRKVAAPMTSSKTTRGAAMRESSVEFLCRRESRRSCTD